MEKFDSLGCKRTKPFFLHPRVYAPRSGRARRIATRQDSTVSASMDIPLLNITAVRCGYFLLEINASQEGRKARLLLSDRSPLLLSLFLSPPLSLRANFRHNFVYQSVAYRHDKIILSLNQCYSLYM